MLAAIRPDSVNLPLLIHVLGAMMLVGTLLGVTLVTVLGWRSRENAPGLSRFALKMLLLGVLPAYLLMRVGAQWTESESKYPEDFEPSWLGVGYITADAGALLILISLILGAIGLRKLRDGSTGGVRFARIVGVISIILLAAYVVAVWAMTTKPT
jgi:hypothetical protein